MDPFTDTTFKLLNYPEFRLLFRLFRDSLFVVIALLGGIIILHLLYYLGRRSLIYRRKPPVANWSRRFFPALCGLVFALLLVIWGMNWLLDYRQ